MIRKTGIAIATIGLLMLLLVLTMPGEQLAAAGFAGFLFGVGAGIAMAAS